MTIRQHAMKWWNNLSTEEKKELFKNYVYSGKFTMALSHNELTGSEIEYILIQNLNTKN